MSHCKNRLRLFPPIERRFCIIGAALAGCKGRFKFNAFSVCNLLGYMHTSLVIAEFTYEIENHIRTCTIS
jgi:hypothetical protein